MNADLYEARNSIYCYEGTNVLINKLDIKDNKLLLKAENKLVLAKLFELRKNKKIEQFDIEHLSGIHKYLFEDIYPFAGKFRTENIAKGFFCFAEWEFIEEQLESLLKKLKEEKYLKECEKGQMVEGLAYYMAELNVLHPFREGNGRTIREFIRQLAYVNGFVLDLQNTTSKAMLEACIKSVIDTGELENVLNKCLKPNRFE